MKEFHRTVMGAALLAALTIPSCGTVDAPQPYGAIPTDAQVAWQQMETNMFMHFGPNTFTGKEWGDGTEIADIFAPTDLDCRQWAATAKAAGMKGIIITAKHHDGFCLWPNPVSAHTVAQSSWRGGEGDILKELSEACREYGLKFGVYVSPWDRNDPHYGTPEYNDVFVKTLESALGNYGEVFEQWFDGACGEGPNGKRQVYDWDLFNATVFKMQPDAIIFSNVGPGCRWVGNESGSAGRTCWGTLDIEGLSPGSPVDLDTLNTGNVHGSSWVAAETDVSIRPGWFWKESENSQVKSLRQLLRIYYESVGRNSLLLLNVPPDERGHIHEIDSVRLMEFRAALDEIFAEDLTAGSTVQAKNVRGRKFSAANMLDDDYDTYWAASDDCLATAFTVTFPAPRTFNRVMLQEYIPLGQRIAAFRIEAADPDGTWKTVAEETTIGYKRLVLIPTVTASALRVSITKSYACPVLSKVAVYMDNIYSDDDGCADGQTAAVPEETVRSAGEPLTADLGKVQEIKGFTYVPVPKGEGGCVITYDLLVSEDGKQWTKVLSDAMFDNIVNNPIPQEVVFPEPVKARLVRLVPLRTSVEGKYGYASFEPVF